MIMIRIVPIGRIDSMTMSSAIRIMWRPVIILLIKIGRT